MTAGRAPSSGELRLTRPAEAPEDAIVRVVRVAPEHAGMRVDVFLASQLRSTSRTRARAIVENSAFSPARCFVGCASGPTVAPDRPGGNPARGSVSRTVTFDGYYNTKRRH